jgi:hypothetical protein
MDHEWVTDDHEYAAIRKVRRGDSSLFAHSQLVQNVLSNMSECAVVCKVRHHIS